MTLPRAIKQMIPGTMGGLARVATPVGYPVEPVPLSPEVVGWSSHPDPAYSYGGGGEGVTVIVDSMSGGITFDTGVQTIFYLPAGTYHAILDLTWGDVAAGLDGFGTRRAKIVFDTLTFTGPIADSGYVIESSLVGIDTTVHVELDGTYASDFLVYSAAVSGVGPIHLTGTVFSGTKS